MSDQDPVQTLPAPQRAAPSKPVIVLASVVILALVFSVVMTGPLKARSH